MGLGLLVKAFAAGESTSVCQNLVDEFVSDASNVVIFAKKQPPASLPSSSESVGTLTFTLSKSPSPSSTPRPKKRCVDDVMSNDMAKTIESSDVNQKPSRANMEVNEKAGELAELAISLKGKRRGFAEKWIAVVEKAPWTRWAASFVPFLPPSSPGRIHFNGRLLTFFQVHGQAMWERYFCLPDRESPKSTTRLRAAIQEFGLVVHQLFELEGVNVFLFLAHYPHPSWPILSEHSLLPYNFQGSNFVRYLEAQHMKRWPSCADYCMQNKSSLKQTMSSYQPLAFLDWAAKFTPKAGAAFHWTFMQQCPTFFTDLKTALQDKTFDPETSPYISVQLPEPLPSKWSFPNDPQTKLRWDWVHQCAVDRSGP
ncbi:hypothetical protein B5M09_006159 [Aphanomyces astaci]|uniref:Uncharacterized protein n=1 Tax=Aphanomyces astaci TaxID=112090 RepID=A0A3R7WIG8_APHAT|nr:hypothetical protein B5M09_006159 [Aphanomyces astaci]